MTAIHGAPAYSGESFWLTHVGNDVRLHHRFPTHLDDRHQQAEQLSLCIALRFLQSIAAPAWQPRVHLKKGMPRAIAELPMLRTSAIVFDQPTWAITFPRSLLRRRLPAPKTAAPRPAELERWHASAPGGDLVTTLTQVIGTAIVDGDAGIGRVAGWVGTSTDIDGRKRAEQALRESGLGEVAGRLASSAIRPDRNRESPSSGFPRSRVVQASALWHRERAPEQE